MPAGRMQMIRRLRYTAVGTVRRGVVIGGIVAAAILFVSAVAFYLVENGSNPDVTDIGSGFVWVTRVLIQGEPPFEAATGFGLVIFYVVVITGVGLVALATGAIATKIIEIIARRDAGMGEADYDGHIIICGWSSQGDEILRELHAPDVSSPQPVVILADLETKPVKDSLVTFVRGQPNRAEDLIRAGIERAGTAIILADRSHPSATDDQLDAQTLMTALAVESINPAVYTCVEVIRPDNRTHFQRAKADELIVSAELTGTLLASSAITHGVSRAVSGLLSHDAGSEFYCIPVPAGVAERSFDDALAHMKASLDCLLVGIQNGDTWDINPSAGRVLRATDQLLVIAAKNPAEA